MSLARLARRPLLAAIVITAATAVAQPPDAAPDGPEVGPRPGFPEAQPGRGPRGEGRPGEGPRRPGGPGGPPGGPSPERFTEHAFSFDADGDGKLDRDEFEAFSREFHERLRRGPAGGPGGPDGPGRPRRPGGPGRPGGERPQRPPELG